MNAATITNSSYTLTPPTGPSVAATVTYDAATMTATLISTAPLTASTQYTAKLDTTIKAADGVPLASAATWKFTTTTGPTATNPVATITSPLPGTTYPRGTAVVFKSTFTDAGAGAGDTSWTCTIDWGDGKPPTVVTLTAPGACNANHIYLVATSKGITLTVTDNNGGTVTVTRAVNIM
jgi:hypothetical protein